MSIFRRSFVPRTYTLIDALSANNATYISRLTNNQAWEYTQTFSGKIKRVKFYLYPDIAVYNYYHNTGSFEASMVIQINKKTFFDIYYKTEETVNWVFHSTAIFPESVIYNMQAQIDKTPNPIEADISLPSEYNYHFRIVKREDSITVADIIARYGLTIKSSFNPGRQPDTWLGSSVWRIWARFHASYMSSPMLASHFALSSSANGGVVGAQFDSSYGDVDLFTRNGTQNQWRVPGFGMLSRYFTYSGEKITYGPAGIKIKQTSLESDGIRFRVQSPAIYSMDSKGNRHATSVAFRIDYQKEISPGNFGAWVRSSYPSSSGTTNVYYISGSSSSQDAYYTVMFPERGKYNVKIERLTADSTDLKLPNDTFLTAMIELENTNIAYVNTAVLGVKLKATDKISGATPKINVIVSGVKIRDVRDVVASGYGAAKLFTLNTVDSNGRRILTGCNPANIVFDIMTNKRYGAGKVFGINNLDMRSLVDFANYCDENVQFKISENDIPDYSTTYKYELGDYVKTTTKAYRCIRNYEDNVIPSNISLSNTSYWRELVKSGVNFLDYHKRFEINMVLDSSFILSDLIKKICETCRTIPYWKGARLAFFIDKPGIPRQLFSMGNIKEDSFEETYIGGHEIANQVEATYLDEDNDYEKKTVVAVDIEREQEMDTLSVDMQLYGLTNRYRVHREMLYCLRKAKAIRKSVKFSCNMSGLLSEIGDVILFQHSTPLYGDGGHVVSVSGTTIKLDQKMFCETGKTYTLRVQRKNATDLTNPDSIFGRVTFVGNNTYKDTFTMSNVSVGDVWTFGPNLVEAKPFRVISISKKDDSVEIGASEYNESVYDDTLGAQISTINYSGLGNRLASNNYIPNVTKIYLSEFISTTGGTTTSNIDIEFVPVSIYNKSSEIVSEYEIYYRRGGDAWTLSGKTKSSRYTINGVQVGETYYVAVRPKTNKNRTSSYSNDWYLKDEFKIVISGEESGIYENGCYAADVFAFPKTDTTNTFDTLWLQEPLKVNIEFTDVT